MIEDKRWGGVYSFEDSPYIMEILTELRDKDTDSIKFRKGLVKLGRYMGYEITKTMDVEKVKVETPLEETEGIIVKDRRNVVIITVLRAAIPFMEGLIKVFEHARVGIVSAARGKPPKFEIEMNYIKIPQITPEDTVIVADPMIATGSTLLRVLEEVKKYGTPKRTLVVGVLAAPEGITRIKEKFPEVEIFVAKIDRELNDKGYILPGLGDAGDRAFGEPVKITTLPQVHYIE
ncbi:uracil phosphoribosyltransferase [Pyrococcus furiosus DSM 3638]|uniref:Uracil phosphoribosyltransferase n=3 Tax=Pyrococcus furiosus TaxID=2261 RepID=UPP_PYRFU|nr:MULTISPECIES: uracil phosphoribosyltransferase [Pyrococcus]Q8U1G7.1 RecName: Full=Uracil phosphoribosyltransferase; AltName: Full=UMP pyrophosphorylase; AltName: Full=UPRTase [Pyrococcus furiosus DSM 3638]AAL81365.1 uracil phosphoribosyltransferase [Pyrococcus furiosus DSM 3638]AFN04028.1 uracil phosphoribosyltransferase [Pyrococcus furiosus COM1]MDK2869152.1 uracil phosphoribosyltransferase [Pyrococcus sp.]QEK78885.1 uracil phosphoribosyltransferase [Pyrococcus furiosus DSM 3638]